MDINDIPDQEEIKRLASYLNCNAILPLEMKRAAEVLLYLLDENKKLKTLTSHEQSCINFVNELIDDIKHGAKLLVRGKTIHNASICFLDDNRFMIKGTDDDNQNKWLYFNIKNTTKDLSNEYYYKVRLQSLQEDIATLWFDNNGKYLGVWK